LIGTYGSFNIIANTTARNHFSTRKGGSNEVAGTKAIIPEYVMGSKKILDFQA
jgi:hypothetical protein